MWRNVSLAMLVVFGLLAAVRAEEPAAPLADLLRQLDAESFQERQAASEALAARGVEALPALIEAVGGESAEAATRALEILSQHLHEGNAELKAATRAALAKLAAGEGKAARRAQDLLKPKTEPSATPRAEPAVGGIRVFGGGIRAVGGAGKRISVKSVGGVKDIEVVEGDRTIKIHDDPDKGIKMSVTDKKDGKEETKDFEAKNADELKEKHPEQHKLYEQYAQGGAGAEIRVEFGDIRIAPGIAPAPLPAIGRIDRPAIIREPRQVLERLEKAEQQLNDASARLKKLAETSAEHATAVQQALESIETTRKQLQEIKEQFPARE